jgi:MerR family transcriptional regulator, copper efflux regulator
MTRIFLPISEVARRFGIRASTLRYYEEMALLVPAMRRSGRRYYGLSELKRLALIQLLQGAGRLSLQEIADVVASQASGVDSRRILSDRIAILDEQIRSAEAAKSYLEYRLSCPRENPFDGCPVLAKEVDRRLKNARSRPVDAHATDTRPGHCHPKGSPVSPNPPYRRPTNRPA